MKRDWKSWIGRDWLRRCFVALGLLSFAGQTSAQSRLHTPRPSPILLANGSFEGPLDDWEVRGTVTQELGGYYGQRCAVLRGSASSQLAMDLELSNLVTPLGRGSLLEAGAWVHLPAALDFQGQAQGAHFVELRVLAEVLGESHLRTVATGRWFPSLRDQDHWVHLQAPPSAPLAGREVRLRLEIHRSFEEPVQVDFLQLGPQHSIDGNPSKRVSCSYVGRYRAPQFASGPQPATASERWRNWHWQTPPACDSSFTGFYHSPDCEGGADCRRDSGRRDSAASPIQSPFDLPLVGSYDSRDPAILRYHVQLAEAAGIDHFIFDYQGQAIAEQELGLGRDPINAQTLAALMDVCEAPSVQLKLAVMYEPKVHMLGWVAGQPSKAQKIAGITNDLVWLVQRMEGKRATLQRNGRMVVFLFRNQSCNPSKTQCLTGADWNLIHSSVLAQTGEDLFLVGDTTPGLSSPIQGFSRWQLLRRDYLTYRTWSDARDGNPTTPLPVLGSLTQHVRELDLSIRAWVNQLPLERLGILTLWPGFDDSGVGGWGSENLQGEDGAALCVRVADPFDGAFYSNTVAAAFDGGYDWVQIATWNDWNEGTRIEPAWHREYLAAYPFGQGPSQAVTEQVFGRLIETRQWIEAFKGQSISGPSFRAITRKYFSFAWQSNLSPLYD